MTRFEALRAVNGVSEYSALIFDILRDKKSPDDMTEILSEELTEKQLQTEIETLKQLPVSCFLSMKDYLVLTSNEKLNK